MIQALPKLEPATGVDSRDKNSRRKHFVSAIAIFILCQLVALLFVELVLNIAGMGEEEIMAFDPETAYVHMGNKHVTWRREGYSVSYFDKEGMREPNVTVSKPAGTYRIALLGDSMVEGLQVPLKKTFGQILEQRLTNQLHKPVQVLNFGVFGYSTLQEYLLLKKQVLKFHPDLVLLCYDERDMLENIETWTPPDKTPVHGRPYAIQFPGHPFVISTDPVKRLLSLPKTRLSMAFNWIRENSRIWGVLTAPHQIALQNPIIGFANSFTHNPKAAIEQMIASANNQSNSSFQIQFFEQQQTKKQANATPASKHIEVVPRDVGKAIMLSVLQPTTSTLLEKTKNLCTDANAKFSVIALPTCSSFSSAAQESDAQLYGVNYAQEIAILKTACREDNIPFFDCEQKSLSLPKKEIPKLFFTIHYTPLGQAFIAEQLLPFVKVNL